MRGCLKTTWSPATSARRSVSYSQCSPSAAASAVRAPSTAFSPFVVLSIGAFNKLFCYGYSSCLTLYYLDLINVNIVDVLVLQSAHRLSHLHRIDVHDEASNTVAAHGPDMRERRRHGFSRGFERSGVSSERNNALTVRDEIVRRGRESFPITRKG